MKTYGTVAFGLVALVGCGGCGDTVPMDKGDVAMVEAGRSTGASGEKHRQNRLAQSTSPYLLQHASNPVDWYPWGEEAFAKAVREDKPIFLSIGYSACHWCHVMERESFENEAIAALLNRHFISIKVDREERPDVDDVYMRAVQMLTGSGGWPMSVFLTPDLKPFHGGTYFPPEDRHGLPGFSRLLTEIARLWDDDRQRLEMGALRMFNAMSRKDDKNAGSPPDARVLLAAGERHLTESLDPVNGGFGGAPKFPPTMGLRLLMRRYAKTGRAELLQALELTLDKMLQGGIHDQVGGGFHRYSVDTRWLVPHFEKMLYDNALLANVYVEAFLLTGENRYADVARKTLNFVLSDMRDDAGAFHASWDADSEGEEGRYYVWTVDEVRRVLPEGEADLLCRVYGITRDGNFEGSNILHLPIALSACAATEGLSVMELEQRLQGGLERLLLERRTRVPPHRDDKVLTNWSALTISALARAANALGEPAYLKAAREASGFLLKTMNREDGLLHSWRRGQAGAPANLDDYAYLANALLDLYQADPDPTLVSAVRTLGQEIWVRFYDERACAFYFTEAERPHLITREKCDTDNAAPAAGPVAAEVLMRLGRLTGEAKFEHAASAYLATLGPDVARYPGAFMTALNGIDANEGMAEEVVIAGDPRVAETVALVRIVHSLYRPDLLLCQWNPDAASAAADVLAIPLLEGRTTVDGKPAAYVCRNRTCQAPVTDRGSLSQLLKTTMPE